MRTIGPAGIPWSSGLVCGWADCRREASRAGRAQRHALCLCLLSAMASAAAQYCAVASFSSASVFLASVGGAVLGAAARTLGLAASSCGPLVVLGAASVRGRLGCRGAAVAFPPLGSWLVPRGAGVVGGTTGAGGRSVGALGGPAASGPWPRGGVARGVVCAAVGLAMVVLEGGAGVRPPSQMERHSTRECEPRPHPGHRWACWQLLRRQCPRMWKSRQ